MLARAVPGMPCSRRSQLRPLSRLRMIAVPAWCDRRHTPAGVWRRSHHAGTAIMRSRDNGRSWELLEHGIPGTARANIEAMSLVSYPTGFSLFVGNTDGEVYESEDGGDSWSKIAEALGPVSKGNHFVPLRDPNRVVVA